MKDNEGCFDLIFWLLVSFAASVVGYYLFEYVVNSDYPDWLKYIILR